MRRGVPVKIGDLRRRGSLPGSGKGPALQGPAALGRSPYVPNLTAVQAKHCRCWTTRMTSGAFPRFGHGQATADRGRAAPEVTERCSSGFCHDRGGGGGANKYSPLGDPSPLDSDPILFSAALSHVSMSGHTALRNAPASRRAVARALCSYQRGN